MEYSLSEPLKPIFFDADNKFLVSFKVLSIEPKEHLGFTLILTCYPNKLRSENNRKSKALHFHNVSNEDLKTIKIDDNTVEYSVHLQPSSTPMSVRVEISSL